MDILLKRILSLIPDRHGADAAFARSIGYKSGNVIADWRAGRSASYRGKLREIAAVYGVAAAPIRQKRPPLPPTSRFPAAPPSCTPC